MAFHMLMPKRIEIIEENIRDFIIEKFIMLKALTKIIVRPVKNENQLDIVLGSSRGMGDIFFVAHLFIFVRSSAKYLFYVRFEIFEL